MNDIKKKSITGFIWRFLQSAGTSLINFIVTVVLARILMPSDYGLVAMVTVFTSIALVFVNTGFSSAIVQKKDLNQADISTAFLSGLLLSVILYILLFLVSPSISSFYHQPLLTKLLRVESLMIIIGATSSIPQALITRDLKFNKSFIANLLGVIVHGLVGIILALNGFGPWALVYSTLASSLTTSIFLWVLNSWKPRIEYSKDSFISMFAFSVKMLLSSLLDTVFNNIRSLIIGRQYSSEDLAFYNKGYQFPQLPMGLIDGSMTTVLFSSLSKYQDNWDLGLNALRRAMKTSLFICLPLMAGLFAISEPVVLVLLTDKWAPCIEYVRYGSIICAMWPLSARRHALNSRGRSGISLALNIFGKAVSLVMILLTYKHSVKAMILGSIWASLGCQVVSTIVYSKTLSYKIKDQLADIVQPLLLSMFMASIVYWLGMLPLSNILKLLIQIPTGILVYFGIAKLFKFDSLTYLLELLKEILSKRNIR